MPRYDLLSVESDAKTKKGNLLGFLTAILYLSPAKEANGVTNLCGSATAGCILACLNGSGMAAVFPSIRKARIAKTLAYFRDEIAFIARLANDVRKLIKHAAERKLQPAVRINGTSDVPKLAHAVAAMFPNVQFYDYTKHDKPWLRIRPNYHLTYSFSGSNLAQCIAALKHGINVAVVFYGDLPATWNGYRVIDGDISDLRFLDPQGVIVGLSVKPNAGTRSMERDRQIGGTNFIQIGMAPISTRV